MTTRGPRQYSNGKVEGPIQATPRPRNARETAENSPAAAIMGIRAPRDTGFEREEREETTTERAAMSVPPRNRWQVLMVEYELLDSDIDQVTQRVWTGGLVLIGLSLVGLAFLAGNLKPGLTDSSRAIALVGTVGTVLSLGWFVLLRRLFTAQRIAEYRRNEIERELGLRSGLYMTFLRQSRRVGSSRESALARQLSEGDADLEEALQDVALSPEAHAKLPGFLSDRLVWSLVPWVLAAAWVGLYLVKI
ncbi:MAG: hypothetical protein HY681_04720 [Chloroflexi bacterium]|nr:hypothetical protein [Chloroflexota bacterium]